MKKTRIKNGEYEVLFSGSYSIHDDKLTFNDIEGFVVVFLFLENGGEQDIYEEGDDKNKSGIVVIKNFTKPFGSGTEKPFRILENKDGDEIFFSIFVQGSYPKLCNVTITFYKKYK